MHENNQHTVCMSIFWINCSQKSLLYGFLVKLLYNNGYLLCCEGTNLSNTHSYYRYREIEIMIVEG